jgi:two-component system, OmpR family, sensor kinase
LRGCRFRPWADGRRLGRGEIVSAPPRSRLDPAGRQGEQPRGPALNAPARTPAASPDAGEHRDGGWRALGRSTRIRLVVAYLLLLLLSATISTLAIRAILIVRLDERVEDALAREYAEIDRHVTAGRNPVTGRAFPTLEALFDSYFAQHVPDNEEAVLTFVRGRPYRANLEHFPLERIPADEAAHWAAFSAVPPPAEDLSGDFSTSLGDARFRTAHVALGDETGAFAVAILPAGELQEIGELQTFGVAATLGVLLLASAAAWLIVGRALAPVRELTETARSISRSDLTRRVDVHGSDEAAVMARSFNRMLDRIETVFRHQREFVQDASHELRDPLTICRGHLELLGDDPDERHATVTVVLDELDRISRIVDDLQLLAEVEQPDFLRLEEIDLGPFTRELVTKASALASRDWSLAHEAQGTLVADRHRLTEAVLNLAHNAAQHTFPDDSIAIGADLRDGEARIWVADTGRGILLSDQERIFDRFTRGRGSNRLYPGSGLGLAIVKAIAEAHGGRVELESELGAGSTFTIVLPLDPLGRLEQ